MSQGKHLYRIWAEVLRRCMNPNSHSYVNYGGRGITVCERWKTFENFHNDLYESYTEHVAEHGVKQTTIERMDVNGHYQPDNVSWATRAEQAINRRSTLNAKGVRQRPSGRWEAKIKRYGQCYLKSFPTEEQALEWRNLKLMELSVRPEVTA